MKRIEITVDNAGNSQVETKGFSGSECLKASKFIETALGKQKTNKRTGEFYQVNESQLRIENEN